MSKRHFEKSFTIGKDGTFFVWMSSWFGVAFEHFGDPTRGDSDAGGGGCEGLGYGRGGCVAGFNGF